MDYKFEYAVIVKDGKTVRTIRFAFPTTWEGNQSARKEIEEIAARHTIAEVQRIQVSPRGYAHCMRERMRARGGKLSADYRAEPISMGSKFSESLFATK